MQRVGDLKLVNKRLRVDVYKARYAEYEDACFFSLFLSTTVRHAKLAKDLPHNRTN